VSGGQQQQQQEEEEGEMPEIRKSLSSCHPKRGTGGRRPSIEEIEEISCEESRERSDRDDSLLAVPAAAENGHGAGQRERQRQPTTGTTSLGHGLAKLGASEGNLGGARRHPSSAESESGKSVMSRLSHLRRPKNRPALVNRSASSSDLVRGPSGGSSQHPGPSHHGSDGGDPPGASHAKEHQYGADHQAKASSYHGRDIGGGGARPVSRKAHPGHNHSYQRRPTFEGHAHENASGEPYIANDESDHVSVGIELAIRSGQVPRLCDERGRCLFHPHIRLQKPKLFGGWKMLFQHCPDCTVEHMKKTQEELTAMQLLKGERKAERERERKEREEEQERRRSERRLEKKKRHGQKERERKEKERGEDDPIIGKNVGDENFAAEQRKAAKKKSSSSHRKKERDRRRDKEHQQRKREEEEEAIMPAEAAVGNGSEKSKNVYDSEGNDGNRNYVDGDDQQQQKHELDLTTSTREPSQQPQKREHKYQNTTEHQLTQPSEQPLDQSSQSLAIVPHKPKKPKSKKVNGLPWSDYNGHSGRYTGEVNEQYLPHGQGEMVYDRGVISVGMWFNGVLDTEGGDPSGGGSSMVVSQEAYTPDTLSKYCMGDKGEDDDMIIESKKATAAAVAEIRSGDGAFVRRSDGSWTYAVVKDRTYGGDSPTIRFKVNVRGSTKAFPTSQWGTYVRRIRKREDPSAPKNGSGLNNNSGGNALSAFLDSKNRSISNGGSGANSVAHGMLRRGMDSDNVSVGSAQSAPMSGSSRHRSVDNLTTAKMKVRTRSRSRSRNRKNVTTLPLLFSSSMSVSEENEGHDNDDWETASGSGYRLRGIDP